MPGDYVLVVGINSKIVVLSVESGEEIGNWNTPGTVLTIVGGMTFGTLAVGGSWSSLILCDIQQLVSNALSASCHTQTPTQPQPLEEAAIRCITPVASGAVRSSWMSKDGSLLAYADGSVCRVMNLEESDDSHALQSPADISCIWGKS